MSYKNNILCDFPKIKLSYENVKHNKVYNYDLIFAIPEGKKGYLRFQKYKNNDECFFIEVDYLKKQNIKNILSVDTNFSKSLNQGTILYGTFFKHLNTNFFSIEDIFFCNYQDLRMANFDIKINVIINLLKKNSNTNNTTFFVNDKSVICGLPLISQNQDNFNNELSTIKYKIYSIQFINFNYQNSRNVIKYNKYIELFNPISNFDGNNVVGNKNILNNVMNNFFISPDIQNDIYHLYNDKNEYIGVASIPDYQTSVMMNNLFRNIKENDDLDKLEESDDECEFENTSSEKFVDLNKSYLFNCQYNKKFKKWIPIKCIQNNI